MRSAGSIGPGPMPLSLPKLTKRGSAAGPTGLDLDGGYLSAVTLDGRAVASAASAELPPGVIAEGEVRDADALSQALKRFARDHSLPKRVRLGVSNQQIVLRQVEIPLVEDPSDRRAAIRFQAAEAIAMPLEEAVLDYQVVGERVSAEGATTLQVIVVAARETMIASLLDAVRGAGLRPEGIDLNAFALVRVLFEGAGSGGENARVYCHLGGAANLAIAVGQTCLFTRPLSAAMDEDGIYVASELAEEVRMSIDYHLSQPDAPLVADVMLSGPGSATEGLGEELGLEVGLPVQVAAPLGPLSLRGVPEGEDPTRHTVAAGLALGAAA